MRSNAPPCPLCAGRGAPAFEKRNYPHFECDGCGTWFVHPVPGPEALAAFYSDAAGDQNSRICWEGTGQHAHATWRRALCDAERLAGRGPLLDVGCGTGQFLGFARAAGWSDLHGTELGAAAARVAADRTSARVHEGDFRTAPLEAGRFAAVTLWDVLEHLPDPSLALRRARELLRPGGVLMVGTPHRHGVTLRTFGARAMLVMPPEHLFLASRAGLRAAAEEAGLDVVRLATIDVHLRQWLSWARRVPDAKGARAGGAGGAAAERSAYRGAYARITGAAAFGVIQGAANAVLRATQLGDQLLAVLRRRAA